MKYTNPVYPESFADPFVWRHEGMYYAVGTGPAGADGMRFPLLHSRDLVNWKSLGHALIPVGSDLGNDYWAPEVEYSEGRFYLYYSVGHGDKGHHLRVAVSERPEGPYEDVGTPLMDLAVCPFSIDASPFQDDDGQWYLFYARDFLDTDDGFRAGTGIAMDRLIGMTRLAGEEQTVVRARSDWQMFKAQRPMYDGIYDWHTLEGPIVRKHDGRYYCFYSGGCYQNETYGVDYAVADSVVGSYSDVGNEDGARVLRSAPGHVVGPGHNSFVSGPDGEDIIVYHAWDTGMTARRMCIDPLIWTPDGPRCQGPTWTEQKL
jgi:arabinan endo-1,5-alpha-L-arabinosidase